MKMKKNTNSYKGYNNNINLEEFNDRRTKCIIYTRVMGYHRPVESFNPGKISEHKDRVYFKEEKTGVKPK